MNMKGKSEMTGYDTIFLGEEDFMDKLVHIARPLLEKNCKTGYFISFDGARIFYEYYENPCEKAAVVISHGFCEFTKKFEEVIFYFFQAGYSVYILDHRGHGYSSREVEDLCKIYIASYDEYVRDFHSFVTQIVLNSNIGHRKLVLYAHSMGGAIAALFLEQYPDIFTCAILSSPMLDVNFYKIPALFIWLVMLFKKLLRADKDYVPGHKAFDGIPRFKTSSCLSEARYNSIFMKRLQDIHYQTHGASCAWTLASLKALRKLKRHMSLVRTPVLLFQAGNDSTVKRRGQIQFAKKSKNTRLVSIPEAKHEIYNANSEIRQEYYRDIFSFLDENTSI